MMVKNNIGKYENMCRVAGKYSNNVAMCDIVSALSSGLANVRVGHDISYYSSKKLTCMGLFANISSMVLMGLEMEPDFKELYEAWEEMVK